MAYLFANVGFNQFDLDLGELYREADDDQFNDNVGATIQGQTYNDVYYVWWGGYSWLSLFAGGALSITDTSASGSVNGYFEHYWSSGGYQLAWGAQGISIGALDLLVAAQTTSTSDERALIEGQLTGADTFDLSNSDDRAYSLGGNDRLLGNGGNDHLHGGGGRDTLFGGLGNDTLVGASGRDRLEGGSGNDRMVGGGGGDSFVGGGGRDIMFAGNDNARDVFIFASQTDSARGRASRDQIRQFDTGEDRVNLSLIDANTGRGGDQSFNFSNGSSANSVWVREVSNGSLVRGDTNGDSRVDFEIFVRGVFGLSEGDFIL